MEQTLWGIDVKLCGSSIYHVRFAFRKLLFQGRDMYSLGDIKKSSHKKDDPRANKNGMLLVILNPILLSHSIAPTIRLICRQDMRRSFNWFERTNTICIPGH